MATSSNRTLKGKKRSYQTIDSIACLEKSTLKNFLMNIRRERTSPTHNCFDLQEVLTTLCLTFTKHCRFDRSIVDRLNIRVISCLYRPASNLVQDWSWFNYHDRRTWSVKKISPEGSVLRLHSNDVHLVEITSSSRCFCFLMMKNVDLNGLSLDRDLFADHALVVHFNLPINSHQNNSVCSDAINVFSSILRNPTSKAHLISRQLRCSLTAVIYSTPLVSIVFHQGGYVGNHD